MRALITGGTGFVGHHVLSYLLEETDWELVALDSFTYAGDPAKVTLHPRLRVVYHDLRAPIGPLTAERIGDVDYIFNLASASHVDRSIEDPVPFVQNNVALVLNMLEYARQVKPRLFLQFSTDEVFGPAPDGRAFEEWDRHIPSNPYAASKSAQEAIAISYWRTFGVPLVITNTMNVFGENQHPEKFVPLCIQKLGRGELVPIHAELRDGVWVSGSRYWIYARDVAEALRFIAENIPPVGYPQADRPQRFNIVGSEEKSNLDVAVLVAEAMGVPVRYKWVDFHSSRPGHDRRYALSGARLAAAGWKPSIGLEEGLCRMVKSSRLAS